MSKTKIRKGYPECWGTFEEYPNPKYIERHCGVCGFVLGCAYKTRKKKR